MKVMSFEEDHIGFGSPCLSFAVLRPQRTGNSHSPWSWPDYGFLELTEMTSRHLALEPNYRIKISPKDFTTRSNAELRLFDLIPGPLLFFHQMEGKRRRVTTGVTVPGAGYGPCCLFVALTAR
jgi:hypothetical protein